MKKNNNTEIHVLGTVHGLNRYKKKIHSLLEEHSFDAVLLEGVGDVDDVPLTTWLSQPYLYLPLKSYFYLMNLLGGSELTRARLLAEKKHIKTHSIDISIDELINGFNKWYTHLVFSLIFISLFVSTPFLFSYLLYLPLIIIFLTIILLSMFIYTFGYFVLYSTRTLRDKHFAKRTKEIISKNDYSKVLVIFGKLHLKPYKKHFDIIIHE